MKYIPSIHSCYLGFVRADCDHILGKCIDHSRLAKGLTAEGLCNILSPLDGDAPCIPLSEYLRKYIYTTVRQLFLNATTQFLFSLTWKYFRCIHFSE